MQNILIKENFTIADLSVKLDFRLDLKGMTLLTGDNGVGKTTSFIYLLENRERLFPDQRVGYMEQKALTPVNDLSVGQLFDMLREDFSAFVSVHAKDFGAFHAFPLLALWDKKVKNLSGGENQLVKFMCCLYLNFDFYLLDEPLHSLDENHKIIVIETLKKLHAQGKGIFVIEHLTQKLDARFYHVVKMFREGHCVTTREVNLA